MAEPRSPISAITEATCETCIYSRPSTRLKAKLYCTKDYHMDIAYACDPGDWCGKGQWLVTGRNNTQYPDVIVLDDLYEWFSE